ncbi:MAG: ribosomal protein S19 family protein [Nanoarchaeota archaeon]
MAEENFEEQDEEISLKKKELTYRGKLIEELKELDIREFAKLLKSNEKRTALRQHDQIHRFVLSCNEKILNNKPIRTHLREMLIVPKMVGMRIHIHNGKEFVPIDISFEMLGHRLGEFSVTRSRVKHGAAGIGATRSSASQSVK